MMRFGDLKERFAAVRSGKTDVADGISFSWVAPAEGDLRRYASKLGVNRASWGREMIVEAVVGWSGVKVHHLIPEERDVGDEPLDFAPEAVGPLLDQQVDWFDRLTLDVLAKYNERKALLESERKKRESASNGS
jgi:hypothetical protein